MSTLIFGKLIYRNYEKERGSSINSALTTFCCNNGIGIRFKDVKKQALSSDIHFHFQLTENLLIGNCDYFMEPIIYTFDGIPLLDKLKMDIEKLHGFINTALSFNFIEKVELYFSFVEVDYEEYENYSVRLSEFNDCILQLYMKNIQVPVAKISICR